MLRLIPQHENDMKSMQRITEKINQTPENNQNTEQLGTLHKEKNLLAERIEKAGIMLSKINVN